MADRPILFSAPMVRALIAGTKTQTRRVLKPQPEPEFIEASFNHDLMILRPALLFGGPTWRMLHRLAKPGDTLWVRESIDKVTEKGDAEIGYKADWQGDARGLGWRPSIHMPRWASRLTLTVTDVRVQRLQDISEDDAIAEGAQASWGLDPADFIAGKGRESFRDSHRLGFRNLWIRINGQDAWDTNPWVVAYSFRVEHRNIDLAASP